MANWTNKGFAALILALILGLIGWSGFWTVKHFVAEAYCNTVRNSTLNRDLDPPIEEIEAAIGWDRSNAEYWYKLAVRLMVPDLEALSAPQLNTLGGDPVQRGREGMGKSGREGGRDRQRDAGKGWTKELRDGETEGLRDEGTEGLRAEEKEGLLADNGLANFAQSAMMFFPGTDLPRIVEVMEQAVRLNPLKMQYHQLLGWAYAGMWDDPEYQSQWLPAADEAMDRAAFFGRKGDTQLHLQLGNYWVMRSKSVLPTDPMHQEAWDKAKQHYGEALDGVASGQWSVVSSQGAGKVGENKKESKALKRMREQIRAYVWSFYPDEEMVDQVLGGEGPS